jgi:hypothetical protein
MNENMHHNMAPRGELDHHGTVGNSENAKPSGSWISQPGLEDWSGILFYQTDPSDLDDQPFERVSNVWEILGRGAVGGTVKVIAESKERAVLKLLADSFGERGVYQWLLARNEFINGMRPIDALRERDSAAIWAAAEAALAGYYE